MLILQLNKRRGLRFVFSGMMFVLSMLRCAALSMRIVWACYPHRAAIAIASGILTQTGSVLVFLLNIILSQRIVRGYHPQFGWHWATNGVFGLLIGGIVASLVMVITVTIQTFFTLDKTIRNIDRIVQLVGGTMMAGLAFVPIPIVILAAVIPRHCHVEKFGGGRWRTKVRLVIFTSVVATLGAAFRVGTAYLPRPASDPAWYHTRPCYYCFNFVTDLIVSVTYLITRFDRRFIVPNGAKGPGDYDKNLKEHVPSPTDTCSRDDAGGDEVDHEKLTGLAENRLDENSGKHAEEPGPPRISSLMCERGKGKSKSVDDADKETGETHELGRSLRRLSSAELYKHPGQWEGLPWPPPVPWWASPRQGTDTRMPGTSSGRSSSVYGEGLAPEQFPFGGTDTISNSQASTKCGGESSTSATYIQDGETTHVTGGGQRHFHPRPLHTRAQGQGQGWAHALPTNGSSSSNNNNNRRSPRRRAGDTPWPFTNQTYTSGRSPNAPFGYNHSHSHSRAAMNNCVNNSNSNNNDSNHDRLGRSISDQTNRSRASSYRTASRGRSTSVAYSGLRNGMESLDGQNWI